MKVFVVLEEVSNDTPYRFGGVYTNFGEACNAIRQSWNGWLSCAGPYTEGDTSVMYCFMADENHVAVPERFTITEFELDEPFNH